VRVGVLASGAGTNLQALLDDDRVDVAVVGSDKRTAFALQRAREAGVPTGIFERRAYADRAERDRAMADWLVAEGVEVVVLAGYMQLVSAAFLARFPAGVVNVHPALLPAFPGLDAIGQALAYGVAVTGVTVHFVDEGVDSGPIIAQAAVALGDASTPDAVHDLLRPLEHRLLCDAVVAVAAGRVTPDPANPRRMVVAPA
jgi:phosphoribosylglycinamide formyltransferase 1